MKLYHNDRCHICLDDFKSIREKHNKNCCGGFICDHCLIDLIENNLVNCPLCRDELSFQLSIQKMIGKFVITIIKCILILFILFCVGFPFAIGSPFSSDLIYELTLRNVFLMMKCIFYGWLILSFLLLLCVCYAGCCPHAH